MNGERAAPRGAGRDTIPTPRHNTPRPERDSVDRESVDREDRESVSSDRGSSDQDSSVQRWSSPEVTRLRASRSREVEQVEDFLRTPRTWGQQDPTTRREPAELQGVRAIDMLHALAGQPCEREELLLTSEGDQLELNALSEALLEFESGQAPALSAGLRSRLRNLVPGESTQDLHHAHQEAQARASAATRRSKRATGRARRATTRRIKSGRVAAARTSSRGRASGSRRSKRASGVSTRRRSNNVTRMPQRPAVPAMALGVLATAAGLLVALALVLQSDPLPRRPDLATSDPQAQGPRGPLVSDVLGKEPPADPGEQPRVEPAQQPAQEPALAQRPAARDPLYPRPRVEQEQPEVQRPSARAEESRPEASPGASTRVREPVQVAGDPTAEDPAGEPSRAQPESPATRVSDDGGRLQLALSRVAGNLALSRQGADWRKLGRARGELELQPGDRLRSGKRGAFLSLDEGGFEICLDANSEVLVRGAASGPVLGLERGKLLAEVRSLPVDRRFVIATEQGDYAVLGTVFAVEASAAASRVLVAEGTVAARNARGETKVPAGQTATITREAAPALSGPVGRRDLQWARGLQPRRQLLFDVSFDDKKLGGFQGQLERDGKGGLAMRLNPLEGNKFWGQDASIQEGRINGFRPGPDVYVQFSLWVEGDTSVLFQAYNSSQKKEFKQFFAHPGGYWRTFTVPLLELSTYYDPGQNPVRKGDLFVDLEIYAGRPGDTQKVLLDDVQIYRRVYR